ncbi:LuxR C-terminal-related transcriptional regulator [Tropicimonas sp. TH_r6]|uniref:helix-turn-helix transcriptional regulator n=1 Tax=Tropicimonas sp. TH_r6 TaxID=3082085 RepID=UPI002955B62F|nr:LuxR C-terminal-related transcriptional regulator [Tropicimonas sp. TH_r6]MDV7142893.1 LuxR C-terminal-related transcriptional regulator [Tropicimonas sp. TH_r6]
MTITLLEHIARVKPITQTDRLWEVTRDYYYANGARMIAYRHFIGRPEHEPPERMTVRHEGFPEELVERLFQKQLVLVNPIPELASRTADPFFWSDIPSMTELLDKEEAFLDTLKEMQIGDGLAIQVFGPSSRNGIFNIGFGGDRPDLDMRALKELQLAGQLSHLAYIRMTPDYMPSAHGTVAMTDREREVLEWIARGKSNSVIAEILGISAHTVDTHVRRIFRKLDVNDRTTAAVKGLGAGLFPSAA